MVLIYGNGTYIWQWYLYLAMVLIYGNGTYIWQWYLYMAILLIYSHFLSFFYQSLSFFLLFGYILLCYVWLFVSPINCLFARLSAFLYVYVCITPMDNLILLIDWMDLVWLLAIITASWQVNNNRYLYFVISKCIFLNCK